MLIWLVDILIYFVLCRYLRKPVGCVEALLSLIERRTEFAVPFGEVNQRKVQRQVSVWRAPSLLIYSLDALRDVAVSAAFTSDSRSERRYCALKARSAA